MPLNQNEQKALSAITAMRERLGLYKREKEIAHSDKVGLADDCFKLLNKAEANIKAEGNLSIKELNSDFNEFFKFLEEQKSPTLNDDFKKIYADNMKGSIAMSANDHLAALLTSQSSTLKKLIPQTPRDEALTDEQYLDFVIKGMINTYFSPEFQKNDVLSLVKFSTVLSAIEALDTPRNNELMKLVITEAFQHINKLEVTAKDKELLTLITTTLDSLLEYGAKLDNAFCNQCLASLPPYFSYPAGAARMGKWLETNKYTPAGERLFVAYLFQFAVQDRHQDMKFEDFLKEFGVKFESPKDLGKKLCAHILESADSQPTLDGKMKILEKYFKSQPLNEYFTRTGNKDGNMLIREAYMKYQLEYMGCSTEVKNLMKGLLNDGIDNIDNGKLNRERFVTAITADLKNKNPTMAANIIYDAQCLLCDKYPGRKNYIKNDFEASLFGIRAKINANETFSDVLYGIDSVKEAVIKYTQRKESFLPAILSSPSAKETLGRTIYEKLDKLRNDILNGNYDSKEKIEVVLNSIITNTGSPTLNGQYNDANRPGLETTYKSALQQVQAVGAAPAPSGPPQHK